MSYYIQTKIVKPPVGVAVMAWDDLRWVRARYIPKHHEEAHYDSSDNWFDYSEKDDTNYFPEGWYELQSHGGDALIWHITGGAEYWMHMPEKPVTPITGLKGGLK